MYLKFMEKVEWRSWEKQGKASKYFCATVDILQNSTLPGKYQNVKKGRATLL